MARTTHHRQRDHFGIDLASHVELDNDTTTYSGGSTLFDVIDDMDDRIATSSGGSGGGLSDLLTGDDADFIASVGNWVADSGTLTRDTTYKIVGQTASLKWDAPPTGTNHYIEVPVAGTFTQGVPYVALVYLSMEELDSNNAYQWYVQLGLAGTDSSYQTVTLLDSADRPGVSDGHFTASMTFWTPNTDRTGVSVRIFNGSTDPNTIHVGAVRVWQTPTVGVHQINTLNIPAWPSDFSGDLHLTPWGTSSGGIIAKGVLGRTEVQNLTGVAGYLNSPPRTNNYSYLWAEHTPADVSEWGVEIDAGDDYLALYCSEKDAGTYQLYGYEDQDMELRDRGVGHWFVTNPGDTVSKNLIEMEQRKGSGSATITSGNTSITVTHGAGYTPTAQDLVITPTNNPTNDPGNFWVDTIGATTFAINVRSNPGASGAIFAWRVDR